MGPDGNESPLVTSQRKREEGTTRMCCWVLVDLLKFVVFCFFNLFQHHRFQVSPSLISSWWTCDLSTIKLQSFDFKIQKRLRSPSNPIDWWGPHLYPQETLRGKCIFHPLGAERPAERLININPCQTGPMIDWFQGVGTIGFVVFPKFPKTYSE